MSQSPRASRSSILVFGPQALSFDQAAFADLHSLLETSSQLQWALDSLSAVSSSWNAFASRVDSLKTLDGQSSLQQLILWLRTGEAPVAAFPLSNILLSPLVIITHLAQVTALIKAANNNAEQFPKALLRQTETLGLCIGALSAAAVSTSSNLTDLRKVGSTAISLAALTGAVADAELLDGPSASLSCSWASPQAFSALQHILSSFQNAYISVFFDEKRATVICSQRDSADIIQRMKLAGVHITPIALQGRFHFAPHEKSVQQLLQICKSNPSLALPQTTSLAIPFRLSNGGQYLQHGDLNHVVLKSVLSEQAQWFESFKTTYNSKAAVSIPSVICFGSERAVPSTLVTRIGPRLTYISDIDQMSPVVAGQLLNSAEHDLSRLPDERIAVIGMAGQVANAADLEQFWDILVKGESQHREVPADKFDMNTAFRKASSRKWYGNFINDYDAFDHKFFKKSPREMSSTDPQHRLALQTAYQAVQQSGYFSQPGFDKHIACYMGVGNVDYEDNIACYPENAYCATGNLKSFLAGKISHYFGWTGPSLTLDTACSSSSVAIHHACRAIINGEATSALAGGVNVITSPDWYHNLAGASFLCPTGQCKPFDAKADGYCRGEGVAVVFLKKYSAALEDGDQIYGVIAGSKVYQNQNCTAITVPNAPSLSQLFSDTLRQARIQPQQVSVVEAHGTGTPVGDPAEFDGIRSVFGGPIRHDAVQLTSVKGLVGHTECASGAVSLLKVLLMLNKEAIPPQASFTSMNPALKCVPEDHVEVPTALKKWDSDFRAALINNYGASGSNASLVVTESCQPNTSLELSRSLRSVSFPFRLSAMDKAALCRYVSKLKQFLVKTTGSHNKDLGARNLSYQLAKQSNFALPEALILTANSLDDLVNQLDAFEKQMPGKISSEPPVARPVIFTFGGQVSTFVGLDRDLFDNVTLLRKHLDACNAIIVSQGHDSIYPDIFLRKPLSSIQKLQLLLFSMQYSCAKAWIDSGVVPVAVVGHSFGELTAMCLSNAITLPDAIRMIAARAKLVETCWVSERGSMMAVEADPALVQNLLSMVQRNLGPEFPLSIACYNSASSFTLSGHSKAVNVAFDLVKADPAFFGIKSKKLKVTNAFHSALVDSLQEGLSSIGNNLTFHEPTIHLERTTEQSEPSKADFHYPFDHMRQPVYFHQAVQRLEKAYPEAIWLEAGSNSTVASMASRAAASPGASIFQPVNITTDCALQFLVDTTTKLWTEGLRVSFWAHHSCQTLEYDPIILPPYQFEKSRHWMALRAPPQSEQEPQKQVQGVEAPTTFTTFVGYPSGNERSVRFRVNTQLDKIQRLIQGHIMAQVAGVWPGTFQLDVAIDALMKLRPEFRDGSYQPQMRDMQHQQALVVTDAKEVYLEADAKDEQGLAWDFRIVAVDDTSTTQHTTGTIVFRSVRDPAVNAEFEKLERLSGKMRCKRLLQDTGIDNMLQGRNVYRAFSEVIDYKENYRHITKIVGQDNESASQVVKTHWKDTWLDTTLADCFGQTAGIFVNLMTDSADISERGMFICDGIGEWIRSPKANSYDALPETWNVYAVHHQPSDKKYMSDVFAFDARDGSLVEAVLGISYVNISVRTLRNILGHSAAKSSGSTPIRSQQAPRAASLVPPPTLTALQPLQQPTLAPTTTPTALLPTPAIILSKPIKIKKTNPAVTDIPTKVRGILDTLCGVEPHEVQDDSDLVEMGLDSLMSMELVREVHHVFNITLENDQLMDLTDFKSLVACVAQSLGVSKDDEEDEVEARPEVNGHVTTNVMLDEAVNGLGNGVLTNGHVNGQINGSANERTTSGGIMPAEIVLQVFQEAKEATDKFIIDGQLGDYYEKVMPRSTALCIAHICNSFERLGCNLRTAAPGSVIERIIYQPKHEQFMDLIYELLEKEGRLIDVKDGKMIRTSVSAPIRSTESMLADLIRDEPVHAAEHRLTEMIGKKFSDCLVGKEEGIQLIFGSPEGREIVTDVYAKSPINSIWIQQAEWFLRTLGSRLPNTGEPLKILEMGAGTGGTTVKMLPMLASLNIPVEYTMTDLSSSLVAGARKRFKHYPFMKFKTLNIEAEPDTSMLQSQHIILATNCVHATRDLPLSTSNIHKLLRPDGFLLLLEMTEQVPWVDFTFGLVEGWWLFEDDRKTGNGRHHALQPPSHWDKTLRAAGYGHVDWTEGNLPEASIQRLIIAMASGPRYDRIPVPRALPKELALTDVAERQTGIDSYVSKYTKDFGIPMASDEAEQIPIKGKCILITGATGSLGSHMVAHQARQTDVFRVICLNRERQLDPLTRQIEAFASRGISLTDSEMCKLVVLGTNSSKPRLGLDDFAYNDMVNSVTHIVHNAWPMSIKRAIRGYETQFQVFRNLIDLASAAVSTRPASFKFIFQFISSIGVVGYWPIWKHESLAIEQRTTAESVLPVGYADAKLVCERMLDSTLHRHPNRFRTHAVRIGQIAGSSSSGYWNAAEHLVLLFKSSVTLRALPDLPGTLAWCPVDTVAETLGDLLSNPDATYPIYHIDNPQRQSYPEMIRLFASCLNIPFENIVPFDEWVTRVARFPGLLSDNPAGQLVDFFRLHFLRMSCGGLVLDTKKCREHSSTLRQRTVLNKELIIRYIDAWKQARVLL